VVEEQGLFPEMAGEFPDHIEVLRSEHRRIERVLAESTAGPPDDPTWPDRLLGALLLLREHILKEQDGVFPAALAALDADQWERIEDVRAQFSTVSTTLGK
jgi:hemerythrin-like domain-containing protein